MYNFLFTFIGGKECPGICETKGRLVSCEALECEYEKI